jgi:hypothetical protein
MGMGRVFHGDLLDLHHVEGRQIEHHQQCLVIDGDRVWLMSTGSYEPTWLGWDRGTILSMAHLKDTLMCSHNSTLSQRSQERSRFHGAVVNANGFSRGE